MSRNQKPPTSSASHSKPPASAQGPRKGAADTPLVSAAHLASGELPELSEVEFGMIVAGHAFERWMVRCMAASGYPDMGPIDVLVLHTTHHRGRPKKLAEIGLVLNIEDAHIISYAVKKLERLGLVETGRQGKEKIVQVTAKGRRAVARYCEVRELCLIAPFQALGEQPKLMQELARFLRVLSGQYDQAARAATSL